MTKDRMSQPIARKFVLASLVLCGSASAETLRFTVNPERSHVNIHVGKAGAFKFAGHSHDVVATKIKGEIVAVTDSLGQSSVALTFESAGLKVSEKGEPAGDAAKVQEAMAGPKLLDVARFPTVTFKSTAVTGAAAAGEYKLDVTGDVTLHGVTQRMTVPVIVKVQGSSLEASGRLGLLQKAFGLTPVSAGGGTVKVKDEVAIEFTISADRSRAR